MNEGNEADLLPVIPNDEIVPIVFRVDNHFRIRKALAKSLGLDKKGSYTVIDGSGTVWDVRIGIEFSDGKHRYYVKNMKQFVKNKKMVPREEFTLNFDKGKRIFLFD